MLALLTPGTVLLFVPSLARWGRRWIAAVIVFYLLLSSQAGAGLLARTLTGGYRPLASADRGPRRAVVVVLGPAASTCAPPGRQLSSVTVEAGLRVLEAARLFELLNGPLVIASGGVTEHDAPRGARVGGAAARADRRSASAPIGSCSSRSRRTRATKRPSSSGCWRSAG